MLSRQPPGAAAVRNDIGDGFAVDGKGDALTGLDRIDHLARSIPKVTHPDLHVRQRSTVGVCCSVPTWPSGLRVPACLMTAAVWEPCFARGLPIDVGGSRVGEFRHGRDPPRGV